MIPLSLVFNYHIIMSKFSGHTIFAYCYFQTFTENNFHRSVFGILNFRELNFCGLLGFAKTMRKLRTSKIWVWTYTVKPCRLLCASSNGQQILFTLTLCFWCKIHKFSHTADIFGVCSNTWWSNVSWEKGVCVSLWKILLIYTFRIHVFRAASVSNV